MKLFRDEQGVTTVGMALSLLISLALVFSGLQVYRINSAAAEVQDVADAAALAAENRVGEFMVLAQFCDAVVLSLTLSGLSATSLGIVAACIPPTAALSKTLLDTGTKLLDTRDRFAERAASALNKLQCALPFIAAASAARVATANNAESAQYLGIALLVKAEGTPIEFGASDNERQLAQNAEKQAEHIREKAAEAEEKAQIANESKQRAYEHDCGSAPSYCMFERAEHLAGLTGADNPYFSSIDTWSFSHALDRAKAYYQTRRASEMPTSSSVAEQARSALRSLFYDYAAQEMSHAYVHETADGFEAYFPHLPKNTNEMRSTALYRTNLFPISSGTAGTTRIMHAYQACPQARSLVGWGSLALMEREKMDICPACEFSASSLGRVASASTSIENGFEYHYEIVANEAARYQKALEDLRGPLTEVKEEAGGLLENLSNLIRDAFNKRINPSPPGRYGAIALVANVGATSTSLGTGNAFVPNVGQLNTRVAISAATLLGESAEEGRSVINSMLDGLRRDGGAAVGAAGIVLDTWSFLLQAYTDGSRALTQGIQSALDAIPLMGASGLGTWASTKLSSLLEDLGLQPADLKSRKAVLVNSTHVAEHGDDAATRNYLTMKQRVLSAAHNATDLFSTLLNDAQLQAIERIEGIGDSIEIASVELLGEGGPSFTIAIPVPEAARTLGVGLIQDIFDRIKALHGELTKGMVWR